MNGTGPEGKGPDTGRGLGKCKKYLGKNYWRNLAKEWANAENQEVEKEEGNV